MKKRIGNAVISGMFANASVSKDGKVYACTIFEKFGDYFKLPPASRCIIGNIKQL